MLTFDVGRQGHQAQSTLTNRGTSTARGPHVKIGRLSPKQSYDRNFPDFSHHVVPERLCIVQKRRTRLVKLFHTCKVILTIWLGVFETPFKFFSI